MQKVKTRIYFCGGTGLNIGLELRNIPDVCYIDTSDRNIDSKHPAELIFITEGTRGAGGDRKAIAPMIRPQISKILDRFPAGEVNICVFGMSGGSGSVIGPMILSKLASEGENVIALGITGVADTNNLNNAIDTIKTLEGISVNTRTPIPLNYYQNAPGVPFSMINQDVQEAIYSLVLLNSGNHHRLDDQDVENWLRFNKKYPQLPAQLCQLHIAETRADAIAVQEPISIASLYNDPERELPLASQFYHTVGIVNPNNPDMNHDQLHFVINSVSIGETMKNILDLKTELTRQQSSYRQRMTVIDADDSRDADGFVL